MSAPDARPAGDRQAMDKPSQRQLLLLCDGTSNNLTGGKRDTNVVMLAELLRADPDPNRVIYYDPGVGNPAELPGTTPWDKLRRFSERVEALAFGRGVFDNIAEGYRFLMHNWREGDEIWAFGFSRGAFTARSIAGLVNRFGIVQPHQEAGLPTLMHLYFSDDHESLTPILNQATRLLTGEADRKPLIHFVGVWDTVATVGLPPFALRFSAVPSLKNKRFLHVRQALALDEHRCQFQPRAYAENNGSVDVGDHAEPGSVQQLWFRGAHSDVGGGYPIEEAALARVPLCWLVSQAVECGLRLRQGAQPLATEAMVDTALAATLLNNGGKDPAPLATAEKGMVHSRLRATPLWALSGMQLRDTTTALLDGKMPKAVVLGQHPSVSTWEGEFPQSTEWRTGPWSYWFWLAAVCGVLTFFGLGDLLITSTWASRWDATAANGSWIDFAAQWFWANARFQWWQLRGMFEWGPSWWNELAHFAMPRWAVLWDFALIACYAGVLSALVSRSFARAARLHFWRRPVPVWLNRLGWALPLAVAGDLTENVATLLAITFRDINADFASGLFSVLITPCAVAKIIGLLGVVWLVLGHRSLQPRASNEHVAEAIGAPLIGQSIQSALPTRSSTSKRSHHDRTR
jgi:uncharacterized protein (DUF2235 family)